MKLYYATGACSLASRIVAVETGIPLVYERVDTKTHKTETGRDFFEINPKGYVPALEDDDGNVLTENAAVLQYLADQTERKEADGGAFAAYRLPEWIAFINSELHKNFSPLFANPSAEVRQLSESKIAKNLAFINAELQGKPFLLGEAWSAADAYLFVILTWAHHLKIDLAQWPNLVAFFRRFAARPKVQEAMRAEGLI